MHTVVVIIVEIINRDDMMMSDIFTLLRYIYFWKTQILKNIIYLN